MAQDFKGMIPEQLRELRFLKTHRKNPIEAGFVIDPVRFERLADGSWRDKLLNRIYHKSKDNSIYTGEMTSYSYDEMSKYLEQQRIENKRDITYGILCGYHGLVIVDIDDPTIADKFLALPEFAETFTAASASKGLPHFYFRCKDYSPTCGFDSSGKRSKRMIDVKARGGYAIGPGSFLWSNSECKTYKVLNDVPIKDIDYDTLIDLIESTIGYDKVKHIYNDYENKFYVTDPVSSEIFKKIDCDMILAEHGVDISHNPGDTPFAESVGKRCLSRTGHLWYDHHSMQGGTVINLYSKIYKISWTDAMYALADMAGVTESTIRKYTEFAIKNKIAEMVEFYSHRIEGTMHVKTIRCESKSPEMYIYSDGIYVPEGQTYIQEFCSRMMGRNYSATFVKKVVDFIAARSYVDSAEFFKDKNINLIPIKNGIFDMKTDKIIDYDPKYIFFQRHPVEYRKNATCPNTIKHFELVLNGQGDIALMQELYGSLLYRTYDYQKAFIFYGSGRNGKGKTMDQMTALLGENNIVNISLEDLGKKPFLMCEMLGKNANLAGEIGNAKLENMKVFKMLTGQDWITADRKFKSTITFKNYGKMVFCANDIPETSDKSIGFFSRWKVLGFTKRFLEEHEYKKHSEEGTLKPHYRIMNPRIGNLLTSDEEMSGVFNWALDGLKRLIGNDGFSNCESSDEVQRFWLRKSSSAAAFIMDHVVKTHDSTVVYTEDMQEIYSEYCTLHGLESQSVTQFNKEMARNNITYRQTTRNGFRVYIWPGVTVRGWNFEEKKFE